MFKWFFYILFNLKKFKQHIMAGSCQSDSSREVFEKSLSKFERGMLRCMQGLNSLFVTKEELITYPLLVVCGEQDIELARTFSKRWEELEEKASYIEVRDAGHCANMDNPKVFNALYEEFIKGIDQNEK